MSLSLRAWRSATTILSIAAASTMVAQTATPPKYPPTRKSDQTDTYHGVRVDDPYRWLEDTESAETKAWIDAQNSLTAAYLATIPERATIRDRLARLWDTPKYGTPKKGGDRYFYLENSGLQNQSVLYVADSRTAKPRVLLDPNTLSADGTVALATHAPSPNGKLLAYAVSAAGSDWREVRVRDVATTRDLVDTVKWIKFSGVSWTHDNKGFFYSRFDEPKTGTALTDVNRSQKLYYHRLGKPQSSDELVYDAPDHPDWGFEAEVNYDGQFVIISVTKGTDVRNQIYLIDLGEPGKPKIDNPLVKLIDRFEASYDFVGNGGGMFLLRTDRGAPKGRIIAVDINYPREDHWRTAVGESQNVMTGATVAGEVVVVTYLKDAHSVLRLYDPLAGARNRPRQAQPFPGRGGNGAGGAGSDTMGRGGMRGAGDQQRTPRQDSGSAGLFPFLGEIALPGIGTVDELTGLDGDNEMFYSFTSYLFPKTIFRYDTESRKSELFRTPKVDFDMSRYETRQVFTKSKDGTQIPIFITAKKGVTLDGTNPTLLYGYGGFNISITPTFSPANLVWLEMGGVYAVATLRGGGEYGRDWHMAGTLERKQNVFDDFFAAARYLIDEKYTSPTKLAIDGRSNGGLLVGAAITQHPELFAAALPTVGVMDMLRFQKFTIGWAWVSDYGSSDDSAQFRALYAYSPLHNIKAGVKYPATMVFTGDHDDRVVPGHSFKFAATLQQAQAGNAPVLIRIDTKAGHGAGKPTAKQIDEAADRFAFLVRNLGMTIRFP